ncbi:hypothetical protein SIN8267_01387 [Sinobacterium norvegicum]|uniref:Uncharacterized protein n=1 Tax=Sinobacterium norvegicum TaxID=1641715 RepID=A0ABN8EHZ7_9GAMM|nr:hypothetical protein [Sinobacterium norvegicum]CAH0991285.1 hypothetical protein SIN8267_01387 [Sinobacterium norvegicum]
MKMVKEVAACSVIGTVVMVGYGVAWSWVSVASIGMGAVSALIMAVIVKLSVAFEKITSAFCLQQQSWAKAKRVLTSWLILVGSKVAAMGAIVILFGDQVQFSGPVSGVLAFYLTIVSILIIESLISKTAKRYRQQPVAAE